MNSKILSAISAVLFLILAIYTAINSDFISTALAVVGIVISVLSFFKSDSKASYSQQKNLNKEIEKVLINASSGNFEDRITHIDMSDPAAKSAWALNDLLDQLEAFERDIKESINAAKNGIDYRDIAPQG